MPIVLLHGWGANSTLMLPIAKRTDRLCVIPDMYGFGDTPHGDNPLNVEDYAKGVIKLLDNLQIDKFDIVGHSFGGRVAIYIATKYASRVNKLVLIDSAGVKPRFNFIKTLKVWLYKIKKKLGLDISKYGSNDYKKLDGAMKKTFVNVVNYNQKKDLKNITCPTLIIWGGKDKTTPFYMAKIMRKRIKKSSLFVIEKAGHFSYADNIELFSAKFNAFIG